MVAIEYSKQVRAEQSIRDLIELDWIGRRVVYVVA